MQTREKAIDLPYTCPHDPSRRFYIKKFPGSQSRGMWTLTECREAKGNKEHHFRTLHPIFEELYGFLLHRKNLKHYVSVVYEFY